MVTVPSVLVLGAGASVPYGFPTGQGLRWTIIKELANRPRRLAQTLQQRGHAWSDLEMFRDELKGSYFSSVDAFLEHRREFLGVGKDAIAATLIPCEKPDGLLPTQNDRGWYRYLFERIAAPPTEFIKNNRLSVVTFNYDRSFERAMLMAFQNAYGVGLDVAADCLQRLNVIHVYGQLGGLSELGDETVETNRYYNPRVDDRRIGAASSGIRVFHEDQDSNLLTRARELLAQADHICFLGFGFLPDNVARLGIETWTREYPQLYGSRFGLDAGELIAAQFALKGHGLQWASSIETDAIGTLKEVNFLAHITR